MTIKEHCHRARVARVQEGDTGKRIEVVNPQYSLSGFPCQSESTWPDMGLVSLYAQASLFEEQALARGDTRKAALHRRVKAEFALLIFGPGGEQ